MPAYMVVIAKISDREAFMRDYVPAAAELGKRYGARYVVRGRGSKLLEGNWGGDASVLVEEWPDMATLERFWTSPEYAEVRKLREGLADIQVVAFEGEWLL